MKIEMVIEGRIRPKGSNLVPGRRRDGGLYIRRGPMDEPAKRLAAEISAKAHALCPEEHLGPVRIGIQSRFQRPKSHYRPNGALTSRASSAPGRNLGDVDKHARLVLDALTGVVFKDDSQVVELLVTKAWGLRNYFVITVEDA